MSVEKENPVARLVVLGIPTMRKKQREGLIRWLIKQAEQIQKEPEEYARRYTARLW